MAPSRTPLAVRLVLLVLVAGAAVRLSYSFGLWGPRFEDAILLYVYSAVMWGSAALVLARGVVVREDRAAFLLMGLALACWAMGDTIYDVVLADVEDLAFPNVGDASYYASYVANYLALVLLLRSRLRPLRASLCLDGLVCGLTLAALAAALVVPPVVDAGGGDPRTLAFTLAYPVADGALLCLVVVAFGLTGWRPGRLWTTLGVAYLAQVVADSVYTVQESLGTFESGTVVSALWPVGAVLTALAAWSGGARRVRRDEGPLLIVLPTLAALTSIAVLVAAAFRPVTGYAVALAGAALLAGVLRTALTFVENVRLLRRAEAQAQTDGLTGLGNRRRLMTDLDDALATGAPSVLLFFDLNGFKGYNDAFGHAAGDALLARLGAALAAAVRGHGEAFRLGGDEFCALLHGDIAADDPLLRTALGALAEHGDGFAVTAAAGLVRLPAEASTTEAALQIADGRMYADKERAPAGRRQARDVLLQVLREREPALRAHLDDVAALSVAVGRALELDTEALDALLRAAELHDVGKMALPERLLRKPGPLDAEEWDFVRQHTVVGERILQAAPALRPVAQLVRASHERWDGAGYPDGLAGEAIPLGARVIAVCDAFSAMTAGRPYRPAVAPAEALAELRRCAGSQFDPAVVEAFARALERGAATASRAAA